MTAVFIGHGECYGLTKEQIKSEVIKAINSGVTEFLNGGQGSFDWMAASVVHDLKKDYPDIKSYLIIPYLSFSIRDKDLFDEVIYPEGFEKYHFKSAIPARNKYMVDQSQYAICYVDHGWGGAAQTYERAKKKGLTIVNLGTYE